MTVSAMAGEGAGEVTRDAFIGGAVTLIQPARGSHRSGSDAVLLAATLSGAAGDILDMGAGAGAVGLMAAHANPDARVILAENDPVLLECARQSVSANPSLSRRVKVCDVDLLAAEPARTAAGLKRASFDHVVANPPYRRQGHVRAQASKLAAHVISPEALEGWARTAASVLKPGGTLTMIFAADGLSDLLAVLERRFGALCIRGLHPGPDMPAERLLIRAIKGRRTRPALLPGITLHGPDGSYTPSARAILAGREGIEMAAGR
ncbi:MAG: methyltransferase [Pseudomonadota bacterium]